MAIEQLTYQCWYVRDPGGEDHQNDIHYKDEAGAQKDAAEIRRDHAADDPVDPLPVEVGQFPAPCWIAQCDGPDAHPLEDGEWEWTLHGETRAEIEKWCGEYGWILTRDGQVFCDEDPPDGHPGERNDRE
jgi:hypothetical protein